MLLGSPTNDITRLASSRSHPQICQVRHLCTHHRLSSRLFFRRLSPRLLFRLLLSPLLLHNGALCLLLDAMARVPWLSLDTRDWMT